MHHGSRAGAFAPVLLELDAAAPNRRFIRTRWPRPASTTVSYVIPALNEEHNIGWVLERVPAYVDEVILVDGNSQDDTVAVSRAAYPGIRVVTQDRPGKGAALRAGFAAARGRVIVMLDADRSMDPRETDRFLDVLEEGYDLVKGSRFADGGGTDDMTGLRRFGNAGLRTILNGAYGSDFRDLCYGYMAFHRHVLPALNLQSDGFEIETEIVVRSLAVGLRVAEVPSFERPRAYGESNLNTWRDGRRVLGTLVAHRLSSSYRPVVRPLRPHVLDMSPSQADA